MLSIKGKPLRDHLEARDHHAALQYLYEWVEIDKQNTISEQLIHSLHQLTTLTTDKEWAGIYRNANVIITGTSHQPPDALEVPHSRNSS